MILEEKTILVTGGAGAIGSSLVKSLSAKAKKIIVLDDLSSGHEVLIPKQENVTFIHGSIAEDLSLAAAFREKIDIIFHLAANFANQNSVDNPQKDLAVNGLGTLKILENCLRHECELFVYASSSCVYGNMLSQENEKTAKIQLDTPYAITKMLGEHYTNFFVSQYKLPAVIFRIFNSYGPGEFPGRYRNVIPNFLKSAIEGKPLIVTGSGEETRSFNYVDNLIQAFTKTIGCKAAIGEIMNIGTESETRIIDLANIINKIANNHAGVEYAPRRSWDHISRRIADIGKARSIIGYEPINNLEEGIQETYSWMIKQKRYWEKIRA